MKESLNRLVNGVKSVSDFLSDALDAFKDSTFAESLETATPWFETLGGAAAEAIPPLKFFTKIAGDLLKETDPEKLGFTACTIAFQKAVVNTFREIGSPAGERQAIKEAKNSLKAVKEFDDINMKTFSDDNPFQHKFYTNSIMCLRIAARNAGYVESQINTIELKIQESFTHCLDVLLTNGSTREKFLPFREYMDRGGAEEAQIKDMLDRHAEYQIRLFEQAPVLKVSPFAIKHIYIDTDCKKLTWGDVSKSNISREERDKLLNDDSQNRQPLLKTVIDLIKRKDLSEAIIIQGIAGCGKTSFTLRLYAELRKKGLHPIRIRIKDLIFDSSINVRDALARAVMLDDETRAESSDNLFLDGKIFKKSGVGEFAHISKYVLILDGWDELNLSEEGFKNKVMQMLTQIESNYLQQQSPRIRVILTGRPSDDLGDAKYLRVNSPFLNILRFNPEQLTEYIDNLRTAVNAVPPLLELSEETEKWTIPDKEKFVPVIEKYQTAFKTRLVTGFSELDILGLPLLAYLTVRLFAEWKGNLPALGEDTTTLYRRLIDLTCKEAGKADKTEDSSHQHKIYGEDLRKLLWKSAHAITITGGENISRKELSSRLGKLPEELEQNIGSVDSVLSSLLISFYFKGGHSHLGCEFAHKSFREYLFAEGIVETLKSYGKGPVRDLRPRESYWEDFPAKDSRFELSRDIAKLLAPQWLTTEVLKHVHNLIKWEIERREESTKISEEKNPGVPTLALTWEQWKRIRAVLADLWDWWGEGGHMRPQSFVDENDGQTKLRSAYVNELISWDAPRDERIGEWRPARTTTMDAHLGDGLFCLCNSVHVPMIAAENEADAKNLTIRKYQSLLKKSDGSFSVAFKPSGDSGVYFRNYISRIESAGWHPTMYERKPFLDMSFIDLSGCELNGTAFFRNAIMRQANLTKSNFYGADMSGADLRESVFDTSNLGNASLLNANLSNASLKDVDMLGANFIVANLSEADFTDARPHYVNFALAALERAIVTRIPKEWIKDALSAARFKQIFFDGKLVSREEFFASADKEEES